MNKNSKKKQKGELKKLMLQVEFLRRKIMRTTRVRPVGRMFFVGEFYTR